MRKLRLYIPLLADAGTTILLAMFTAAAGAVVGALVTETLEGAIVGAVGGFLLGAVGFAHTFRRMSRPQIRAGRLTA